MMTAYYRHIEDGYITSVQTTENSSSEGNITKEEYEAILVLMQNPPEAPEGYEYRLREDLTWELVELPPTPDPGEEEVDDSEIGAALEGII